jgi:hypothetical protein
LGVLAPARRRSASENIMKKRTERRKLTDELRREYNLSKLKGVRGMYATRYQAGTNLVLLSPDVAQYFPDEQSVNTALRKLIHVTKVKKNILISSVLEIVASLRSYRFDLS